VLDYLVIFSGADTLSETYGNIVLLVKGLGNPKNRQFAPRKSWDSANGNNVCAAPINTHSIHKMEDYVGPPTK